MSTSLAQLNDRAMIGLGPAAEYVDLTVWHNAVVQALNIRTMQSRSSTVNVLLGTSDEFTPDTIEYDITDLIGKGVPCFIETRGVNQTQYVRWANIRVVPLNQLNEYTAMGTLACSFYGSESSSDTKQATQYVRFTYLPPNVCRIRFDRDGQRIALDADMLLPDTVAELIVLEAQNKVIKAIQLALQMGLRRDEDGRKDSAGIIAMLEGIRLDNKETIRLLDALWRRWAFGDRSKEDNFNLPTPNSSRMYPGGRGNKAGYLGGNGY